MADNYLERHWEDYEQRKKKWLEEKKKLRNRPAKKLTPENGNRE